MSVLTKSIGIVDADADVGVDISVDGVNKEAEHLSPSFFSYIDRRIDFVVDLVYTLTIQVFCQDLQQEGNGFHR